MPDKLTMANYRLMWLATYMPCHDHNFHPLAHREGQDHHITSDLQYGIGNGSFSVMQTQIRMP